MQYEQAATVFTPSSQIQPTPLAVDSRSIASGSISIGFSFLVFVMSYAFDSPREVIERARDHINDLDARIKSFVERKPYSLIVDYDSSTGQDVHKLRFAQIPGKFAAITKDAFSNLRDALDHAVYASAVTLHPGRANKRTAFPFAPTGLDVNNKLDRELIDVPAGIRMFLENLQPHQAGNQTLWGLNQTRNIKTHRMLVPLGTATMGNSTHIKTGTIVGPARLGYHRWDSAKNEAEFLRVSRGSKLNYEIRGTFDVVFGQIEVFAGAPVLASLNTIASEVERVVAGIETETARLLRS
jgi:hypothetical protein